MNSSGHKSSNPDNQHFYKIFPCQPVFQVSYFCIQSHLFVKVTPALLLLFYSWENAQVHTAGGESQHQASWSQSYTLSKTAASRFVAAWPPYSDVSRFDLPVCPSTQPAVLVWLGSLLGGMSGFGRCSSPSLHISTLLKVPGRFCMIEGHPGAFV